MSNKTLSILSYVTIIGWIVAYVKSKDLKPGSTLVNYHLKQGLGLFILALILNIAISIVVYAVPSLYFLGYVGYVVLLLLIFGIINAANQVEKPIPVIGKMFEDKFSFIN